MTQLSYADQSLGINGEFADNGPRDVVSRINENASAIGFGLGVKRGTAVAAGKTGLFNETSSAIDELIGVTVHDHAYANADLATEAVPADNVGSLLKKGRLLVTVETTVADGDDAYVRIANGVAVPTQTTKGGWGANGDSGTRRHVKGAHFRSAATVGNLAILEISDDFGKYDDVLIQDQIGDGDAIVYSQPVSEGDSVEYVADVGTISATTTVLPGTSPAVASRVKGVYLDATVAAGDSTDHWTIQALCGATVLANYDTDTLVDGALTKGTPKAMNLVAGVIAAAADDLSVVFTKNNSAAAFGVAGTVTIQLETDVLVATTTIDLGAAPEDACAVKSAQLSCGITVGDSSNHWTIALKHGSTTFATWDSDTAVDGAVTAGTPTNMNLTAGAVVAAGARLTAVFTKAGTAANITAGMVTVELAAGDALVATTTFALGAAPPNRHMIIDSCQLSCGVTVGDSTDHWNIALKNGATSICTWDSDTAVDGAITQGTPTELNLTATAANRVLDPGDALTLVFTKNNAAANITAGAVTVKARLV